MSLPSIYGNEKFHNNNYYQHVVFGIVKLIDVVIPDIPGSVQLKIDIDETIAKLVLDDESEMTVRKALIKSTIEKV